MTPEEKVRSYLPLVDFLADVVGPLSEVVLHDLGNKEHSLVAIRNGQISDREAGAPMTDFARHLVSSGEQSGKDYITNYLGKAGSTGKFLKSSTFFIKDDDGKIIGILGINSNLSPLWEMQQVLGQLLQVNEAINGDSGEAPHGEERLSVREMVSAVMEDVLASRAAEPERMTFEEKRDAVLELNDKGVFLLKGTIAEVASRLDVSEQTIYRYLKNY